MFESSQINHALGAPLLALGLLAGRPVPPPPTLPVTPEPAADPVGIGVAIDTSSLEPDLALRLQRAVVEGVDAALQRAALEFDEGGADAQIEFTVQMPDVERREYAIDLAVADEGTRVPLVEGVRCPVCSEQQVVDQVVALLPAATTWLEGHREDEPPPQPPPPVETRRLGALGIVGVATLTGGVASMVSGGALIREAPLIEGMIEVAKGQGRALIGVGAGALVLGVAATVVDLTVLDRRRRAPRVEVGVDASPTSAGLRVSGSF